MSHHGSNLLRIYILPATLFVSDILRLKSKLYLCIQSFQGEGGTPA